MRGGKNRDGEARDNITAGVQAGAGVGSVQSDVSVCEFQVKPICPTALPSSSMPTPDLLFFLKFDSLVLVHMQRKQMVDFI